MTKTFNLPVGQIEISQVLSVTHKKPITCIKTRGEKINIIDPKQRIFNQIQDRAKAAANLFLSVMENNNETQNPETRKSH
jgi:hypothetical protein